MLCLRDVFWTVTVLANEGVHEKVKARKLIAPIVLAVVLLAAGVYVYNRGATPALSAKAAPAVPVTAERAASHDMPVFIRGIGTVQAYNAVAVKSRVDGQIVKVNFTEGQEVKTGALLFQIDPRPYQAALALAVANQQRDQAQLVSAQANLRRYTKLVTQGYQTQQALEAQQALVGQIQASIKADAAQIDLAHLNLQYTDIRSPIDGRTGALLVDVGNLVHAADNTVLVTIAQLHPIYVSFTVPQENLDAIRASERLGDVPAEAYTGDDKTKLATGKLTLIDNQIAQATGTIHLKATFANAGEVLWPGEFVTLRLLIGLEKNAVTVPARAVQRGPKGDYLFVVKPDDTVEIRAVVVSQVEQGMAVIAKGLTAGETIVVDGQYRLDRGTKVTVAAQGGSSVKTSSAENQPAWLQ